MKLIPVYILIVIAIITSIWFLLGLLGIRKGIHADPDELDFMGIVSLLIGVAWGLSKLIG